MLQPSQRSATQLAEEISSSATIRTIRDFTALLNDRGVPLLQRESSTTYLSKIISSAGSQFIVYTDDGIRKVGQPVAVVKRAKAHLDQTGHSASLSKHFMISLHRELHVLTNRALRAHPNIVRILSYDFITELHGVASPVIVLERADLGSLHDRLRKAKKLDINDKVLICADMVAGLIALHNADVLHGDMKPDNVLLFTTPEPDRPIIAKLSDFGSVISIASSTVSNARYYGTTAYNAPEVSMQTHNAPLDYRGFLRCEAYSLGLSILEVVCDELPEELSVKTPVVIDRALAAIEAAALPVSLSKPLSDTARALLHYEPDHREHSLSAVLNYLRPLSLQDLTLAPREASSLSSQRIGSGRSEEEVLRNIELTFGLSDYLQYGWSDETNLPRDSQDNIFHELRQAANTSMPSVAAKAHFELGLSYAIGLGTEADPEEALEHMLTAARKGYRPAQCLYAHWFRALGRKPMVSHDTELDWLYEQTTLGSFLAATTLKDMDQSEYDSARREFHSKGGYNQYFYPGQRDQLCTSDKETVRYITGSTKARGHDELYALFWSAAVYGLATVMETLLEDSTVDINQANEYGETALSLCCRGGHIDLLEMLVNAGALAFPSGSGYRRFEPCLPWLVAFESIHVDRAAQFLLRAGAGKHGRQEMAWNFPSIDYPGKFPRAGPLHYAIYLNDCAVVNTILKYWPEILGLESSVPGTEIGTPIEYALALRRYEPARILVQHGALNEIESNRECLRGIGDMLNHEAWLVEGLYGCVPGTAATKCIEIVASKAPDLLDMPDEQGFTPLMCAAQYHAVDVIATLLDYGCSATTTTSPEYDSRTPLNLITENQLRSGANNLIELLISHGADIHHKSSKGGKNLLHFAARDDNTWAAERALDLGIDIETPTLYGETPLHCAAFYGSARVARLLLDRNANVHATIDTRQNHGTFNARNWRGLTPLALAASALHPEVVEMLLPYTRAPGHMARPSTGSTILHLTVTEKETDMLEMLLGFPDLRRSEVLDFKDETHGCTALHYCAGGLGKEKHLQMLLEAGADVNALTTEGFTTLDLAASARAWIYDTLGVVLGQWDAEVRNGLFDFIDDQHDKPAINRQEEAVQALIQQHVADEALDHVIDPTIAPVHTVLYSNSKYKSNLSTNADHLTHEQQQERYQSSSNNVAYSSESPPPAETDKTPDIDDYVSQRPEDIAAARDSVEDFVEHHSQVDLGRAWYASRETMILLRNYGAERKRAGVEFEEGLIIMG